MGVTLHTYAHGELNWDTKLVPVPGSGGDSDLERIAAAINVSPNINGTDLNTIGTNGSYIGNNLGNAPGSSAAWFIVVCQRADATAQVQTAYDLAGRVAWWRRQNGGAWTAWHQYVDDGNLAALIGDTGWVTTTGITAVSGYTISASKYRIRNGLAMVGISGAKNATAVSAGTAGSIANSAFAQLPALLIPSATNGIVVNNGSAAGFAATGYASQATGQLIFTTAPAGIPASGALDAYAEYYL